MKISTLCVHVFTRFSGLQRFFVALFSSIGNFFAKLTAISFKIMFSLQWSANVPENFDHRIDLYHQWQASKNPLWVERGVFNVVALQMFSEPITVELCCGDGFYAKYFYSISSKEIFSCDFDKEIIKVAKKYNSMHNISYHIADIRDGIMNIFQNAITPGAVTNVIWDAAIEHFTEAEIAKIMKDIKKTLRHDGILSGYTIINTDKEKKLLSHHEREFTSKDDLRSFFTPYFKNVYIFETHYPERSNLYFFASDAKVPFQS